MKIYGDATVPSLFEIAYYTALDTINNNITSRRSRVIPEDLYKTYEGFESRQSDMDEIVEEIERKKQFFFKKK